MWSELSRNLQAHVYSLQKGRVSPPFKTEKSINSVSRQCKKVQVTARAGGHRGQRETESRPRVGGLGNGPVTLGDSWNFPQQTMQRRLKRRPHTTSSHKFRTSEVRSD